MTLDNRYVPGKSENAQNHEGNTHNFSIFVRIDKIRVFLLSDRGQDVRGLIKIIVFLSE